MNRPNLTLLAGLLVLVGCTKNQYEPPPPATVTVANPVVETITRSLEFTGTTVPFEQLEVRPKVQGYLEEIYYEPGAEVEAGAKLFLIDPKPFQARVNQAIAAKQLAEARITSGDAQVASATAQARNASLQLQRSQAAAAGGAVTQSQLDALQAALDSANANVKAGQANIAQAQAEVAAAVAALEEAQLDLGHTVVTTAIKGRVGKNLVDIGSLVGANDATHLTTVVRYDPIYAEYTISESDLLMWQNWREDGTVDTDPTGDPVDRTIYLALADEEDFPHEGKFEYADLSLDETTGTFLIRGEFPNPDRQIPPGAFVRIKVPIEDAEAMLVDDVAVSRDQGGTYVLIVNEDGVVERRNIKPGGVYDGRREVLDGLKPSDRVVVNGLLLARPGVEVNPQPRDEPSTEEPPTAGPPTNEQPTPEATPEATP